MLYSGRETRYLHRIILFHCIYRYMYDIISCDCMLVQCGSYIVQLGSRLQHMVATASSVLFDPDRTSSIQKQALVLNRALQLGQAKPLRDVMHKLR